jgi:hypothetical protein
VQQQERPAAAADPASKLARKPGADKLQRCHDALDNKTQPIISSQSAGRALDARRQPFSTNGHPAEISTTEHSYRDNISCV